MKTIAGGKKGFKDGYKTDAKFFYPTQIAIDSLGQYLYISDHVSIFNCFNFVIVSLAF